jgi:hypothetical protein
MGDNTDSEFNDMDHMMLERYAEKIDKSGNRFLLTNSYAEDGFFDTMYTGYRIVPFDKKDIAIYNEKKERAN